MTWMKQLSGFLGGQTGNLLDSAADIADRFIQTKEEKAEFKKAMAELEQQAQQSQMTFKLEMERTIQLREKEVEETIRKELEAKTQFMTAELKQDDKYTKRARPTVIYAGLAVVFLEIFGIRHIILGAMAAPDILIENSTAMLKYFLMAWGGVVGMYTVGRSAEKRGTRNQLTGAAQALANPAAAVKMVQSQVANLKDKMKWM